MVFDDADPVSAANGAAFACFVASGQTCVSGTRLIIQDQVYDEFMAHFLRKVESITRRMGNRKSYLRFVRLTLHVIAAMNPRSTMGSIITPRQLHRIENVIQRAKKASAKVVIGGKRMTGTSELDGFDFSKGCFFAPTVVSDISTNDELWMEEVFGPVVVVKRFNVSHALVIHQPF